MMIKYWLGITLFLLSIVGCAQEHNNNNSDFDKSSLITNLVDVVNENHISPKTLDDQLSKQIFDAFLKRIDGGKQILTLNEIEKLDYAVKNLDDEFKNGTTQFFSEVASFFVKGVGRAEKFVGNILETEIPLFEDGQFESNLDKRDFVYLDELEERWKMEVRKRFVEELYIAEIVKLNQSKDDQKSLALKKTSLFFQDYFYGLKSQTKDDLFEEYLNAYLACNDYQSSYLSPESKTVWDNKFNRNFVGVGLQVETTIDYPRIKEVVFDGPAWKTKQINSGDILMEISNHENQLIDVAGFPLKKVIDLLKGEKGSKVAVKIKRANNSIEDVVIERGQVFLSKTMSFVIQETNVSSKIGYIYLPRFYSSDEGCAADVLAEISKLKKQQVEGIILDFRNNQGGSAGEAREIVGFFLNKGNTLHMVSKGSHRTFEDEDNITHYDGNLLVMVNDRSSSASELVSGNLQDYEKAIIVGSQTVGKGTFQNFIDIVDDETSKKLGEVKLSVGSFYTGIGRTSQYHGIIPDIILPSEKKYIKTGERTQKNALHFENLESSYSTSNVGFEQTLSELNKLSKIRQASSPFFQQVEKKALLKKSEEINSLVELNYKLFKNEKEKLREALGVNGPMDKLIITEVAIAEFEKEKTKYFKEKLESDAHLYESLLIMQDYLRISG